MDAAEPSDSIELLTNLPTDMEGAYDLVLKRIEKKRRPTVIKVLSWLFHARRPLVQDELREAIAVRIGRTNLAKPLVPSDALVQYCHGLITIDESTDIIRFSHFTVKEFLSNHYQDQLLSVVDCARVCLVYMNFEVFEKGPCTSRKAYLDRKKDFILSEYVVRFWGTYTKGQGEIDSKLLDSLYRFLKSPKKRGAARQIHHVSGFYAPNAWRPHPSTIQWLWDRDFHEWTPLHVLANEGLSIFYDQLTKASHTPKYQDLEFCSLDSRDEWGYVPLLRASQQGHLDICCLMLENGADACAANEYGETALGIAAQRGHLELVEVLLNNNAKINAGEGHYRTALHKAAEQGHTEVVKALLDRGADIYAKDGNECLTLHTAALRGPPEVVKLLLDRGVEVDARAHSGNTALIWAAAEGRLEVVHVLLDKGAEINAAAEDGITPLYEAASNGHVDVVEMLLDQGAEINADDNGWTALHVAAWWSINVEVITLLLESVRKGAVVRGVSGPVKVREREEFSQLEVLSTLEFLATEFPEDWLFSRAVGMELFRQRRYSEATRWFDKSVRKRFPNAGETDINCLEFPGIYCGGGCTQRLHGCHYKCKSCKWDTDFCQKCVTRGLRYHEHPVQDMLLIPSQWPLPPEQEEVSNSDSEG